MSFWQFHVLKLACDFCPNDQKTAEFKDASDSEVHASRRKAGWHVYPAQRLAKCPTCVAARHPRNHGTTRRTS